jgi:hypothetical protein
MATALVTSSSRGFSYSDRELHALQLKLKAKINASMLYTQQSDFNYERPQLQYDKATGEINIIKKEQIKKTVIRSHDDLMKEKKRMLKELKIEDPEAESAETDEAIQQTAENIERLCAKMKEEIEVDPTTFYACSRDFMRVDVGLIIMRPPIFMRMSERDFNFLKHRQQIMSEYYMDWTKYCDSMKEVA